MVRGDVYTGVNVEIASPAQTPLGRRCGDMDSPFVRFLPAPSPKGKDYSSAAAPREESENTGLQRPPLPKARGKAAKAPLGAAVPRAGQLRHGALRNSPLATTGAMAAALRELAERGEEWGADGWSTEWSREKELEHTRAIARKVKTPTPPALMNKLNVFIGAGLPAAQSATAQAPKALAAADWEALPAGTQLSVWWEGNQEYFDCTIMDWHVQVGGDGKLFYTHRCEYESGTFDHDLSRVCFDVIEVAACNTHRYPTGGDATPRADGGLKRSALNGSTPKMSLNYEALSPRRRWLAQQELQYARPVPLRVPAPRRTCHTAPISMHAASVCLVSTGYKSLPRISSRRTLRRRHPTLRNSAGASPCGAYASQASRRRAPHRAPCAPHRAR